jgi:hypothetical protein
MEQIFAETLKKIEESIEQQKLIYQDLLSKAETEEQKKSIEELMLISSQINEAVLNKDVKSLTELLNRLSNANNFNR